MIGCPHRACCSRHFPCSANTLMHSTAAHRNQNFVGSSINLESLFPPACSHLSKRRSSLQGLQSSHSIATPYRYPLLISTSSMQVCSLGQRNSGHNLCTSSLFSADLFRSASTEQEDCAQFLHSKLQRSVCLKFFKSREVCAHRGLASCTEHSHRGAF